MQKKRILIFNDCFYMGGTEILLVNLLNHLVEKDNCEITLMLPNPSDKNILLERVSPKVPLKYIFLREQKGIKRWFYKNILIFYPRVFSILIGFDQNLYDEIICFKDGFYSIFFSRLKLPKYLWVQNQPYRRDYKSKSVKEWLSFKLNRIQIDRMTKSFDMFDRVFCVSDSCKKDYIDIYHKGKASRDIEVLYDALDLSDIVQKAEENIEIAPKNADILRFVVVIRLSHEKTVDRVILATDRLLKEGYKFEVQILGDGSEYDKLRAMITEYSLDDSIKMYGRVKNPYPYMKQADWFLCPSSRESFALTLVEAITLGTPVITTACGGPEDVIDKGKYGVFTENSENGVYSGMRKVLDDPSLRSYYSSLSTENLKRFDYYEWLKSIDNILGI